jgi:RimJ/RimL family protein N-acetyltransferase
MSASLEIASPRLRLRPLAAGDRDLYARLYSDPAVMRHVTRPRPPAEVDAGFRLALDLQGSQVKFPPRWIADLRETGQGIGLLGLFADAGSGTAETGIMLLPEAQRRGLATEALRALTRAAFGRGWVRGLWARHAPANQAMARVLTGLGFEADGVSGGDCRWRLEPARLLAGRPENQSAGSASSRSPLATSAPFG